MKNESCGGCKFARKDEQDITGNQVVCCRYPPQAFPIQDQMGRHGTVSVRPTRNVKDWCGEHQPKLDLSATDAIADASIAHNLARA